MTRAMITVLSVLSVASLALAGCVGPQQAAPPAPTTTTSATVPTATTTPATPTSATRPPAPTRVPTPPAQWSTREVSAPFTGQVPPTPTLVAIRVGAHPANGFDRVALDFRGMPGYRVRYENTVTRDGSGQRVRLPGNAYLQLVFNPAQAHNEQGESTLTSPPVNPVRVGYDELVSYVLNGDYEGYVSLALGLAERNGFVVRQFQRGNGLHTVYVDIARG